MTNSQNDSTNTVKAKRQGTVKKQVTKKVKPRKLEPSEQNNDSSIEQPVPKKKTIKKTPTYKRKPRKLTPLQEMKNNLKEPGNARTFFILSLSILIVTLYAFIVEGTVVSWIQSGIGIVLVFLFFVLYQFLLLFLGYKLGSKNKNKNTATNKKKPTKSKGNLSV
ncbi:hypothetical protein bcgnr5369_25310 [Bacillus cereus]|uniref:Uncharacterized protein n=1 Tax=Bacillus thuringiensis TaxID=1428 RepID=A0A9X6WI34_BACTU|nr:hypothetical protein [Bacillus thuringiensis]PFJ32298.1 hypothetical protein COJ15_28935 [Bacillus thuringiensis]